MTKQDFLQECMSEFKGAPIDAFNREFCVLCSNRECSRSWGNSSVFDYRVKNWKEILFTNIARSKDTSLGNPKFESVDTGAMPEIFSHETPEFETISFDDFTDTDPNMPSMEEMKKIEQVEEDETLGKSDKSDKSNKENKPVTNQSVVGSMNTLFTKPITLGNSQQKQDVEKVEPAGCVFTFDDE